MCIYNVTNKKYGFTMAEVLVTIGVIGIVAAMTLPQVVAKHRAKTLEAQFKKNYSMLQQALLEMYREEGQEISVKNYNRSTFVKTFIYYIKDTKRVTSGITSSLPSEDNSDNKIHTLKDYRTYTNKQLGATHLDDGLIEFKDGRRIYIDTARGVNKLNNILLTIDINGVQNKPNRWGFDFFTFEIMEDGRLIPMGAPGSLYENLDNKYCSVNSSNLYNGISCANKALMERDYFLNLPQ